MGEGGREGRGGAARAAPTLPVPAELEQHFGANEQAMTAKATQLQALERQVSGLLQEIQERANAYATC